MPTLTIPTTTLPVGATTVGPLTVSSNFKATITLDRTLAGGMNSLTSATTMVIQIQSSPDGTTWSNEVGNPETPFLGGTTAEIDPKTGLTRTTDLVGVGGLNLGTTQVRGIVTIGGPSSVVTGGSIAVS